LAVDVKTCLVAVYEWTALVERNAYPPDLVKSLKKKTDELNESIQAEQLRFGLRIDNEVGLVAFYAKLASKTPLDYYNSGKYLLTEKKWLQAKDEFLAYQKFADAKQANKLPRELGEVILKDPREDKHLEYLEYLQKKIDEKINEQTDEASLILSKTVVGSNPYTPLKEEWRRKYPYKQESGTAPSSSSSTSSILVTAGYT